MTLARDKRIRKRRDFLRVQRYGIRSFGRLVVVVAKRDKDGSDGKIGITVPKKVGAAHVRNKVKRRIRHILRLNQNLFFEKCLVIVARDTAGVAAFSDLEADLVEACRRLKHNKAVSVSRHRNAAKKVA